MTQDRLKSLFVYTAKCVSGVISVYLIATAIGYNKDIAWGLISVMLVLSPDGKDAMTLALNRIKANLIGVSFGVLCMILGHPDMFLISLAVVLSLTTCYFFKLDSAARSALAASIITMLHEENSPIWNTALDRITGVVVGCLIVLIITYLFQGKPNISKEKQIEDSN